MMDLLLAILLGFYMKLASATQCNSTYTWACHASNVEEQDPCQLVSQLRASCAPSAEPLQPLFYNSSGTNYYPGPDPSVQNICTCSYVMYSLVAACGDCQIGSSVHSPWPTYRDWAHSCNITNTGGTYPHAIPSSFLDLIPLWAQLSTEESGDFRWSYDLSYAVTSSHILVNSEPVRLASAVCHCSHHSYALPVGTAFAGFFAGLSVASLGFFLHNKRRARVIPPPTRYHTAPDNTPLVPLAPRAAYAQGTSFLRRILQQDQDNDSQRIEPFDLSTATGMQIFPPHPAVFPSQRVHAFPLTASASALSQVSSRGPSRQTSIASLNALPFSTHPATSLRSSQSQSKAHAQPQSPYPPLHSQSPVAGPSRLRTRDLPPSEPASPLPLDRARVDTPEDPPAYRRKS